MKKISEKENADFLRTATPFIKGTQLHISLAALKRATGMSTSRVYRFLNYNGLNLSPGRKYGRASVNPVTRSRLAYIQKRIRENPCITLRELGEEMQCSRQSIGQLITRYGIKKEHGKWKKIHIDE